MKYLKLLVILFIPFIFSGCYDKSELDNLAYVIGIGADVDEGENLKITYQIAIPVKIAGENSETGKDTFTTYTVSAPSLYVGNSIVNALTSKEVNLSHIKLIIYSEELARSDLAGHINSLISNASIRPKTSVAICKGTAEDFFKNVAPVLESSPARYYDLILSSFNYTSESIGSELIEFYTSAQSIDKEAAVVIAKIINDPTEENLTSEGGQNNSGKEQNGNKKDDVSGGDAESQGTSELQFAGSESNNQKSEAKFAGIAAFRGSKMVGEISPELTMGHLILSNGLREGTITVPDIETPDKLASITLRQNKGCSFDVNIEGNVPKIKIKVFLDAHFQSSGATTNYLENENKHKLNESVEKAVIDIINGYLDKLIEFDSDIVGIGKQVRKKYLTWEDFENLNWKEIFKNSEFEVETDVSLNVSQIIFHRIPNS